MRKIKINKVRLQVEEYLTEAGHKLKAELRKQHERDFKISFNVKTSFIDGEVITSVDVYINISGETIPLRKHINIVSLIEKGKTNLDAIIEKVDKFLSDLPHEVDKKMTVKLDV